MTTLSIRPVDPTSPAVAELVAVLDALQTALYPPASVHSLPLYLLKRDNAEFLGAYLGDRLVGCGGYINYGEFGELKRMIVDPAARGQGIGRQLLEALEANALAAGLTKLRLETGIAQPEALRLYQRSGYKRRGPFGEYREDPLSVFMEKRLKD